MSFYGDIPYVRKRMNQYRGFQPLYINRLLIVNFCNPTLLNKEFSSINFTIIQFVE